MMSRIPVNEPYVVTTPFGVPDSNALFGRHAGIDYAVPLNRPVYAPASGTLTNVVSQTGGNMVRIFDGKYYHRLMHNNSFSRANGAVKEGDEVAKAGTTGLSTGVHCHWDVATKAVPTAFSDFIDPLEYIKEDMTIDRTQAILLERIITMQNSPAAGLITSAIGRDLDVYLADRSNDADFLKNKQIVRVSYPAALKEIEALKAQLGTSYVPVNETLYRKDS